MKALTLIVFFSVFLMSTFSMDIEAGKKEVYAELAKDELGVEIDYREKGPYSVELSKADLRSDHGCKVRYTTFLPKREGVDLSTMVLLGHGFFRNQKTQRGTAEHVASWGVPIATIDFCNSRPWNGHHDRNGEDMVKVADELKLSKVIYSGFSAGGLASFIAASLDERADAYLGLDMVDNFKKGQKAAPNMKADVFGFIARRSACNAKNNGLEVYGLLDQPHALHVEGATHCDFEFPYDKKCRLACGKNKAPYERKDVQSTILGLSTALFIWRSGVDESAQLWWDKNQSVLNALVKAKRVRYLEQPAK